MDTFMTKKKNTKKEIEMNKDTVEYLQLELIAPTELEILSKNVEQIKESSDKVRKGMFKRHGDLTKKIEGVECRLDQIEKTLNKILRGFALIAQDELGESGQMDTSAHSTQIFAMSVDASQLFAVPEIGLTQTFGKSA